VIDLPAAKDLTAAAASFDRDWGGVDDVLYGLCREFPGHEVPREVTAKLALVDRAYSAGLERQVIPDAGSQAITKIADFVVDHGREVDAIIAELAPLQEPLNGENMVEIVRAHGRLVDLLRQIPTRGTSPRSFAAKYLHFHRPIVPLYDSYVSTTLVHLVRWDSQATPFFALPPEGDPDYWDFCVRFLRLYEACHAAGLAVSVKQLDTYLWAVPGAP
jgi:hypothetical protein